MKERWLEHWSHLHLYRSQWLQDPIFQVVPVVKWYFGNTLRERVPINVCSHTYVGHINGPQPLLPADWSQDGPDRYVYKGLPETGSSYPLPVSSSRSARLVSPRYLFCRTRRAFFRSTYIGIRPARDVATALRDRYGKKVGALNLNLNGTSVEEPPEGTKFELVIISAGSMTSNRESSDILKWGKFTSASTQLPKEQRIIRFYYVMWIEWEDGIAYRKGLGRVLEVAWDSEKTEEINLVLG